MRRLDQELDVTIYGIAFALFLIILLVAINALIYIPSVSSWISDETGSSESVTYWSSQAVPFKVRSAVELPFSSPCGSTSNGYVLELENSWMSTLSVNSVLLDGEPTKFCNAELHRLGPVLIDTGEKKRVGLEFSKPIDCSPGEQKWMDVQIGYTREGGFDPPGVSKEGVQKGAKKLRVECMNTTEIEPTMFHFNGNYLLPPLTPGKEYEHLFQASNGVEPYVYSTSDYLYGLKFDLSGRLYGMPMPFEDLPYEIFITVGASDANGSRVERVYRLPVEGKTAPLPPLPANQTENVSSQNAIVPEETLPPATPLQ